MSDQIRWGILSCARIARDRTIPALLQAENAILYAVAGRDPERLQAFREAFHPVTAYDSYDALLDDPDVDAVYICLPNHLHKEWTIKALRRGKHVLCEKPLAMTAADVKEMFAEADASGCILAEAFSYLHGGIVNKVHEILNSGVLGCLKHIHIHYAFMPTMQKDIRFEKALGGGCTYDLGCYCISFIRDILDEEPADIQCALIQKDADSVEMHANYLFRFPGGVTASAYASFDSATDSTRTIIGTKGTLTIPLAYHYFGDGEMMLKTADGVTRIPVFCHNHYTTEIAEFGECILTGKTPRVSRAHSIGNAEVVDHILAHRM